MWAIGCLCMWAFRERMRRSLWFRKLVESCVVYGEFVIIERTHVARNNEIVIAVVDGEVYVKKATERPCQAHSQTHLSQPSLP